jgi:hypothetical protein
MAAVRGAAIKGENEREAIICARPLKCPLTLDEHGDGSAVRTTVAVSPDLGLDARTVMRIAAKYY